VRERESAAMGEKDRWTARKQVVPTESFDEEEDIKPLVIESVTFAGLGDAANPDCTVE